MDRRKRAFGTLTLAVTLGLLLGPAAGDGSTQTSELKLGWFSARLGYPVDFKTMARELVGVFHDIGVHVRWESTASLDGLKVILLPIEPSGWNLPPGAMGVYLGEDGLQPAVYIFVRNVLRALSLDPSMQRIPTYEERHRIARALGKVAAHEIIHALTPGCSHETEGLMRPTLGRYLLLNETSHLESARVEAIHRGLHKLMKPSTVAAVVHVAGPADEP